MGLMNFKCQKKLIEQKVRVYMPPTVHTFYIFHPGHATRACGLWPLSLWKCDGKAWKVLTALTRGVDNSLADDLAALFRVLVSNRDLDFLRLSLLQRSNLHLWNHNWAMMTDDWSFHVEWVTTFSQCEEGNEKKFPQWLLASCSNQPGGSGG